MKRCMVILMAGAMAFALQADATIINVPGDYPTIQAGIDAGSEGDTVLVHDGIFAGPGNIDIDLEGKNMVIKSQNGPAYTTIDCQGSGRGFAIVSEETSSTIIEGFTIQNGNPQVGAGGAIVIFLSSPIIINCIFESNYAPYGGAIYINGTILGMQVEIIQSSFINNNTDGLGGAIYFQYSEMTLLLTECLFIGNSALEGGGACGSGMFTNATITNCTFSENSSPNGAAIIANSRDNLSIDNSIIAFNYGGEAIKCLLGSVINLICSDVYGNPGGDWTGCIADQHNRRGNISEDPLFCYPDTQNYHIDFYSPCSPDNNECGVLIGALEVGCLAIGCDYIAGDCNHNGIPLELGDVVAIVAMYRGILPPYFTCNCPQHSGDFAPEADPNGNCVAFELGDVVTEIAAYRSMGEVSGCPDCPGLGNTPAWREDWRILGTLAKLTNEHQRRTDLSTHPLAEWLSRKIWRSR